MNSLLEKPKQKGVGGIYPHREIKNKIYTTINQLHDELDKSYELKKELNFISYLCHRSFKTKI